MKLTSALVLSFIASVQAGTTGVIDSSSVENGFTITVASYSINTSSYDASLSSLFSSLSLTPTGILTPITSGTPASIGTAPSSGGSSSSTSSAQATTTSSAAGRTEAVLGLGVAAGAAAGVLGFFF
ncbi:hypothetical protein BD769DRAFT_1674456 [Suillus cothurnatus]|nr:hypothetical protein BD769DRAFT_1674456 [Suillus cothurnatus]